MKKLDEDQILIKEKCKTTQIKDAATVSKFTKVGDSRCEEMNYCCNKCDSRFKHYSDLQNHVSSSHKTTDYFITCKQEFSKTAELEKDLREVHKAEKNYKCINCDSSFILKWRLKKHMKMHDQEKIKTCHYFNNNKKCPYVEIGCKFLHKTATYCKYSDKCKFELCQFRHQC